MQTSDWSATTLSSGQLDYAALDALVPVWLAPLLEDQIQEAELKHVAALEMRLLPAVARMNERGIRFDPTPWRELAVQAEVEWDQVKSRLTELAAP